MWPKPFLESGAYKYRRKLPPRRVTLTGTTISSARTAASCPTRTWPGETNYLKNNPDVVAQLPYAVDSAVWFFETNVADQLGLTTRSIDGGIECGTTGHHAPPKRFRIFEAMAQRVGLTGYSAAGC
jgi:hypothetical protein